MTIPRRLQLSRAKGFNLQAASRALNGLEAAKVDRSSLFGNPFRVGRDGDAAHCVHLYRLMLTEGPRPLGPPSEAEQRGVINTYRGERYGLRGKNLACWCKPGDPCHADVLLELTNQ